MQKPITFLDEKAARTSFYQQIVLLSLTKAQDYCNIVLIIMNGGVTHMKRLVSLIICVAFSFMVSTPVFAINVQPVEAKCPIEMFVDSQGRIITTYQNDEANTNSVLGRNTVKEILTNLGMEDGFVNKLNNEQLDLYATAKQFQGVILYTATDKNGNVRLVDEAEALTKTQYVDSISTLPSGNNTTAGASSGGNTTRTDDYMRIFFLVSYLGNGYFHYSVDATWLNLPFFRSYDTIGACAMNSAIDNVTRSGWLSYNLIYSYGDAYHNTPTTNYFSSSDIYTNINGNWIGSAALFDLPNDISSTDPNSGMSTTITHTNFRVHFEFQAHVNYPSLESYFNATATYCHSKFGLSWSPSVELSLLGNTSASIGLSIVSLVDERIAELPYSIHYVP